MAKTDWAAKVCRSSIELLENSPGCLRRTTNAPTIFSAPSSGHVEYRTEASTDDDVKGNRWIALDIRNLNRGTPFDCLADAGLAETNAATPQFGDHRLAEAVGRAQLKFMVDIIKDIDCTRLGTRKLGCLGDNGGKHGFEIDA